MYSPSPSYQNSSFPKTYPHSSSERGGYFFLPSSSSFTRKMGFTAFCLTRGKCFLHSHRISIGGMGRVGNTMSSSILIASDAACLMFELERVMSYNIVWVCRGLCVTILYSLKESNLLRTPLKTSFF